MGLTTTEFIDELRRSLGNRTDITDERYVRWLNWAMLDICGFHRKRMHRPLRFHELEDDFLFTINIITANCSSATESTVTLGGTEVSSEEGIYVDHVLYYGSSSYLIVAYDGSVATISGTFDTIPEDGDTCTIHKRKYSIEDDLGFSPKESLWVVEKIKQVLGGNILDQVDWKELSDNMYTSMGTPSQFARRDDSILLDYTPVESYSYRIFVYKFPRMLDTGLPDVQSELPDTVDEVIILGAMARGFEKLMEPERANVALQHYLSEISNRQNAYFMEDPYIEKQIKYRRR